MFVGYKKTQQQKCINFRLRKFVLSIDVNGWKSNFQFIAIHRSHG